MTGLDDLEALVHEGRRIHRDLRTHAPVRVRHRLLGRDGREVLAAGSQEGSARCSQHNARYAARCALLAAPPAGRHWKIALCSLSIGRIRAPEARAASSSRAPASTRASLFASSRLLAGGCSRKRRCETGSADDRRHDDFRLRQRRNRRRALRRQRARASASRAAATRCGEFRRACSIDEHRKLGAEALALRKQRLVIGMRGERDDAIAFRMTAGDVERVLADAAGRAEHGEAFQARTPSQPRPSAMSGTDDVRLSMRSSIPP